MEIKPSLTFNNASKDQHFEQIIQLQKENLYSCISEEQQAQQGFVFAEHTVELLKTMAAELPQVIALHDNHVIGYNLAMTSGMKTQLPSLIPMFNEFEKCTYKGRPLINYNFIVGGQVCVSKKFRGHGLLAKLYHETRNELPSGYQLCVTEVSVRNPKSLKAHEKMGFEVIGTYHDGKELWNIIAWDLSSFS